MAPVTFFHFTVSFLPFPFLAEVSLTLEGAFTFTVLLDVDCFFPAFPVPDEDVCELVFVFVFVFA